MLTLNTPIVLLGFIATISAAALPQTNTDTPTTGGVAPVVPNEVDVQYYQAPWDPNGSSCGINEVSNGTLEANTCTPLCTLGLSIYQIPSADCLFTVYKGTRTCTNPSEIASYAIQKGSVGMVCVDVGVVTGCSAAAANVQGDASGVWSCG